MSGQRQNAATRWGRVTPAEAAKPTQSKIMAEHAQAEAERLQKAASRTIRSFGVKPNDEMRDRHLEQTPWWKHVWRGCGYLPICGNHPGTPMLVIMILAGAAAGGWHGGIMLSLLFGPIYLIGAHGRSVYDWQHSENDPLCDMPEGAAEVRHFTTTTNDTNHVHK